jgi:hypothetical protein
MMRSKNGERVEHEKCKKLCAALILLSVPLLLVSAKHCLKVALGSKPRTRLFEDLICRDQLATVTLTIEEVPIPPAAL